MPTQQIGQTKTIGCRSYHLLILMGVVTSLVGPLPMTVRTYDIALADLFNHLLPTACLV